MPWLMDSVEAELNLVTVCRLILDTVIRDVVHTRAEQHSKLEAATELSRSAKRDVPAQPQPAIDTITATAADDINQQQASTVQQKYKLPQT